MYEPVSQSSQSFPYQSGPQYGQPTLQYQPVEQPAPQYGQPILQYQPVEQSAPQYESAGQYPTMQPIPQYQSAQPTMQPIPQYQSAQPTQSLLYNNEGGDYGYHKSNIGYQPVSQYDPNYSGYQSQVCIVYFLLFFF